MKLKTTLQSHSTEAGDAAAVDRLLRNAAVDAVAAIDTFLRLPEVERATGLSRGMIYLMIRRGEFPGPFKLTPKASGWRASEVRAWQDARTRADDYVGAS